MKRHVPMTTYQSPLGLSFGLRMSSLPYKKATMEGMLPTPKYIYSELSTNHLWKSSTYISSDYGQSSMMQYWGILAVRHSKGTKETRTQCSSIQSMLGKDDLLFRELTNYSFLMLSCPNLFKLNPIYLF